MRITAWGTALLAALLAGTWLLDFVDGIYGWTARGAAENYLANFRVENHPFVAPDAPRRIVEVNPRRPEEDFIQPGRNRRFVLCYGNGPIQDVRVAPYGWFWWTFASSTPVTPVTDMDWAVQHWETDWEEATERLNAVIRDYPNTDASRWASETLTTLREQGSGGVRPWRAEMFRQLQEEARRRRAQAVEQE